MRKRKAVLAGIGPLHGKQREIINYILEPGDDAVKLVDVVCGRGFGKTLLSIVLAVKMLSLDGNQCGLFLEPDWDRVHTVFRFAWRNIVPKWLWTENRENKTITWYNGSVLFYGHRNIYGNIEVRRDKGRGPNLTFVISDEEAIQCDVQQYTNTLAAVRAPSPVRFYLTITTPKIGQYKKLITKKGHKVFHGTSFDNIYLPKGFIEQLMESMSRDEIEREIYAKFVALEGRIWREANLDKAWPEGNVHHEHSQFDPKKPWWLFCDLGSATGAYSVVQQTPAMYMGQQIFDDNVWVAVADLCPYHDASAVRAFERLKLEYGTPVSVVAGKDINTRSSGDGKTIAYMAQKVWGNVRILPCDEREAEKHIQFDRLSYLICSGDGNRRFCVAENFREIEPEGKRGIKQMLEEDVWPDRPTSATEFLPKKADIMIQHIRDSLLMGAVKVMAPPRWGHEKERTK